MISSFYSIDKSDPFIQINIKNSDIYLDRVDGFTLISNINSLKINSNKIDLFNFFFGFNFKHDLEI